MNSKSKIISLIATDIGVDAGMILVADYYFLNEYRDDLSRLNMGKVLDIPPHMYEVSYKIPNTWNGTVTGKVFLKVTSGKIVVIDPCYVIGKKFERGWGDWLNETNYGKLVGIYDKKAFIIDSMGGDGCYKVQLKLKEY
jgi:hypothetical protein